MTHPAANGQAPAPSAGELDKNERWACWEDEDEAEPQAFKPLTPDEAQALRARHPTVSPGRVVAAQAVMGVAIALLWWCFAGAGSKAWLSALSGAAVVVIPNALMAWGVARLFRGVASAAALGFMIWELIKIMLAVALLGAVVKWMPELSWPALLVTLIGCLKVNWLALLWRGRLKKREDGH
ncbi:ATP synthase subunit I [Paucibacter sp. R3-3]|uniref:ATP synthase subunit I n=1 Tax=Roseateles agri TaxID=3098619 RepID=A0ABU5DFI5_9BURK|nr:ATP synthase subunit I [Paucibacter sp. R3-3]MDY0745016.1 ATP synthase subunit I [Paucibacter sp. R3-3]